MKYSILGATGATGIQLLHHLRNESVSVYVRNPSKLPPGHHAQVTQGELSDTEKLKRWATGADVVLCTLGHGLSFAQVKSNLGLGSYGKARFITNALRVVLDAKPGRIVHCSAYGTRETRADLPAMFGKVLLPLLIAEAYADHEAVETMLEQSAIDWVVARPGMLTNKEGTGVYRTLSRFEGGNSVSIARADVADFMVKASQGSDFLRRCVGLGY